MQREEEEEGEEEDLCPNDFALPWKEWQTMVA